MTFEQRKALFLAIISAIAATLGLLVVSADIMDIEATPIPTVFFTNTPTATMLWVTPTSSPTNTLAPTATTVPIMTGIIPSPTRTTVPLPTETYPPIFFDTPTIEVWTPVPAKCWQSVTVNTSGGNLLLRNTPGGTVVGSVANGAALAYDTATNIPANVRTISGYTYSYVQFRDGTWAALEFLKAVGTPRCD